METKKIIASVIISTLWITWFAYATNTKTWEISSHLNYEKSFMWMEWMWEMKMWGKKDHKNCKMNMNWTWSEMKMGDWMMRMWTWMKMWEWKGCGMWMNLWMWWNKIQLTTEEETKLSSMTMDEKKAFFDKKHQEMMLKIEAKEVIIDKLINWETLTDAEKVTLEEIKKERKERKAAKIQKEEKKKAIWTIKDLFNKKAKGENLTAEEQAKIDAVKK